MTMATKVITGKCRASFVHIFEPQSINGSDPKYSMSLIIPKSDSKTIGAIKAAIDEAIQNGISGKWGGKRPPNLKLPLRDGDVDREEDEAYQDAYFVNATSLEKPGVVDRKRIPITDPLGVYSGCYVRASINFYPFNVNGRLLCPRQHQLLSVQCEREQGRGCRTEQRAVLERWRAPDKPGACRG